MLAIRLSLVGLFTVMCAHAQTNLQTHFNSTFSGRNIGLTISKETKKKVEFGGGLRFNLFNLNGKLAHPDDQFNTYKKRLYMTEPIHYIGVSGFINRQLPVNWKAIKPYAFYDLQVAYAGTRNRFFLPSDVATDGTVLYSEGIEFRGPFTWVEQNLGVGFKAQISDQLYLNQRLGFGTAFILGYEEQLLDKYYNWFSWSFGTLLSVGLEYHFERKAE